MRAHVHLEVPLGGESLATDRALERLVSYKPEQKCLKNYIKQNFETIRNCEMSNLKIFFSYALPLTCVSPHVDLQR